MMTMRICNLKLIVKASLLIVLLLLFVSDNRSTLADKQLSLSALDMTL